MWPRTRLAIVVLALAAGAAGLACGGERAPRPHIVLVTIDTLRADHLTPYGHVRDTSPFLARLADESVLFRDAISQCGTTPQSLSSLMTGLYPYSDGILRANGAFHYLKRTTAPLAARLARLGYRTHAITSSIQSARVTGLDLGFHGFDAIRVEHDVESSRRRSAGEVTERALAFFESAEQGPGPIFLWLHYLDPHHPYAAPAGYGDRFAEAELAEEGEVRRYVFDEAHSRDYPLSDRELRSLVLDYDREILYTDDALRALFEGAPPGLLDEAIVILTADHGESLGQHGIVTHNELYHSILHVPLLIRLPGGLHAGQVVDAPVMLVDVLPTLLDWLRADDGRPLRGTSLLPLMEGREAPELQRRVRLAEYEAPALYSGRFKWIERGERSELFDLERDPHELNDLSRELPEHVRALRDAAARLARRGLLPLDDTSALPEVTPAMLRELSALGYLEE